MKCKDCDVEMEFVESPGIPCIYNGKEGYWSCPKCYDYWPVHWDAKTKVPMDLTKPIGEQEDIRQ